MHTSLIRRSVRFVCVAAVGALLAACGTSGSPGGAGNAEGTQSKATQSTATPSTAAQSKGARVEGRKATVVKVVAVGDIACEPGEGTTSTTCHQRATYRLTKKLAPKRVIALGDLQYEDGLLSAFNNSYNLSWGHLKSITRPVPGNHEYHTAGAQGFFDYWGLTSPGYRAMSVNGWRIYLLNSNCDQIDCAAQRTWFRNDLNAHPTTCSAMAMHFPRFSSGEHGSNPSVRGFWRIADNHGVDLALAGHDHDYERFAAKNAAGDLSSTGIVSFVVGTGGKSFYTTNTHEAGSQYFRSDKFGVLLLRLGGTGASWAFRTTGGGVRDAGSLTCQ